MQASKAYWDILMDFNSFDLFFCLNPLGLWLLSGRACAYLVAKEPVLFFSLITKRRKIILWYSFMQLYSRIYDGKDFFS